MRPPKKAGGSRRDFSTTSATGAGAAAAALGIAKVNVVGAIEAGLYVDARHFDRVDNVPNWKDVSPRIGAAYDLFGNGKTAVKASIGRYVSSQGVGIAEANNPAQATVISATRTWTDSNGNFAPDCTIRDLAANGECGLVSNNRFGTVNFTRRYSQDVLDCAGWIRRSAIQLAGLGHASARAAAGHGAQRRVGRR